MSWGLMGRVWRHAAPVPGLCLEMVVFSTHCISWTCLFLWLDGHAFSVHKWSLAIRRYLLGAGRWHACACGLMLHHGRFY